MEYNTNIIDAKSHQDNQPKAAEQHTLTKTHGVIIKTYKNMSIKKLALHKNNYSNHNTHDIN